MVLKATYEERIEQAVRIAKNSRLSPGNTLAQIMRALGHDFGDGNHLDAIWAEYYESHTLAEVARLNEEVFELQRKIEASEPK